MLTNEEIARYLAFGFTEPVEYRKPVEIKDISWNDAVSTYRELLEKAVKSYRYKQAAFACSGGIGSASLLAFVDYPVTAVGLSGKWSKPVADFYGVNHELCGVQDLSFEEFEQNIINMHKLFDKPHHRSVDTLIYHRNKKVSDMGFKHYVCEGGAVYLLPNLTQVLIKPDDYDVNFAKELYKNLEHSAYISEGYDFSKSLRRRNEPYSNYFHDYRAFAVETLKDFGFKEPLLELKNDTLKDFRMALADWFWPGTLSTFKYAESFGVDMLSPYFVNSDLWNFCLSLPIEMVSCLGAGKFVLREAMRDLLPPNLQTRHALTFYPHKKTYYDIKRNVMQLTDKYLSDPDAKIYNYLDYKLVRSLRKYHRRLPEWHLTHLAIWLEVNM